MSSTTIWSQPSSQTVTQHLPKLSSSLVVQTGIPPEKPVSVVIGLISFSDKYSASLDDTHNDDPDPESNDYEKLSLFRNRILFPIID